METKYVIAIVAASIFLLLLLIFLLSYLLRLKKDKEKQAELDKFYLGPNLTKMEYDFSAYDEETERLLDRFNSNPEKQVTIDDVLKENKPAAQEDSFQKLESEGMEEITGNYKPDEK